MIKWIDFTKAMDRKLQKYQKENLLTIKDLCKKSWISESSLYKFRQRWKISVWSLKKIKENLWIELIEKKEEKIIEKTDNVSQNDTSEKTTPLSE